MNVLHDGTWFGTEETRLSYDDFDLADGMAYDRVGLDFGWRPDRARGAATAGGLHVRRHRARGDGSGRGGFVPVALDLSATPTTEVYGTDTGNDLGVSGTRPVGSSSRWPSPAPCASETTDSVRTAVTATGRGVRATGT